MSRHGLLIFLSCTALCLSLGCSDGGSAEEDSGNPAASDGNEQGSGDNSTQGSNTEGNDAGDGGDNNAQGGDDAPPGPDCSRTGPGCQYLENATGRTACAELWSGTEEALANFEEDCDSDTSEESATWLPNGCPRHNELIGYCVADVAQIPINLPVELPSLVAFYYTPGQDDELAETVAQCVERGEFCPGPAYTP